MNSLATPYNRGLHRFLLFTAGVTFLLILLGALVTSNDAGLSVPDWPTSFRHWPVTPGYFEVPLVGGVKWEHTHRILAQFVGVLSIVLAVWTWRTDRRRWMRNLGWFALGLVIAQGLLGGITVLLYLPQAVSTAHAALSQAFFCVVTAMAIFTGRRFREPGVQPLVDVPRERRRPSLRTLAALSVIVVYVQLILGAAFRHMRGPKTPTELMPHLIGAVAVTVILLWTVIRVFSDYSGVRSLRAPAASLLGLLMVQLVLGFMTYMTVLVWGREAPQPLLSMVLTSVLHVGFGALVLVHTVILAIQAWRYDALSRAAHIEPSMRKVVPA